MTSSIDNVETIPPVDVEALEVEEEDEEEVDWELEDELDIDDDCWLEVDEEAEEVGGAELLEVEEVVVVVVLDVVLRVSMYATPPIAATRMTIITTKAAAREIAEIFLLERERSKLKSRASVLAYVIKGLAGLARAKFARYSMLQPEKIGSWQTE